MGHLQLGDNAPLQTVYERRRLSHLVASALVLGCSLGLYLARFNLLLQLSVGVVGIVVLVFDRFKVWNCPACGTWFGRTLWRSECDVCGSRFDNTFGRRQPPN